jgi:two-component system, response regulator PdtaR
MSKPRIMVVEDEYVVAVDLQKALEDLGYEVSAVESSGKAAIDKAGRIDPDLILMDIYLKGKMNGIEAAERIRTNFKTPIVYLTAYANKEILDEAKVAEPFGYLVKPFNRSSLKSTIEMALNKAKVDRQKEEYILELRGAISKSSPLDSPLTICSSCKKIRIEENIWNQIEEYIRDHMEIEFTHSICPECIRELYPDFYEDIERENQEPTE